MTDSTTAQMAGGLLDEFVRRYCAELQQLNYGRATIGIYRRSITRLRDLMIEHGVALDALTPDIAAELVLRADRHGDRQPYVIFIVRRFVAYLATLGVAMPPMPPTARELARSALRRDYGRTPGRMRTRIPTQGVTPSLHVYYKNTRIKQYHKEQRALRTETTINNTYDFAIAKRLHNLPKLRDIGFRANRRLLEVERLSYDCILAEQTFQRINGPIERAGQRASRCGR